MNSANAARNLIRVVHELQMPIVAVRGALDFASHELKSKGVALSEDWLADAWEWTDVMVRLLHNAQILAAHAAGGAAIRTAKLRFLPDVITPAMHAVSVFLRERGLTPSVVRFHNLDKIPPIFADKALLIQLFFNLLSNSLKYGGRDPRIEITSERSRGGWPSSSETGGWGFRLPRQSTFSDRASEAKTPSPGVPLAQAWGSSLRAR